MSNTPTQEQMDTLLTFLEANEELARGLLRTADGRRRSQMLWAQITDTVNALGGCIKTTKQWQKLWADKKYAAKKAKAAAKASATATGGGPSQDGNLSALDVRIGALMGDGYGQPEADARVSAFAHSPPREHHEPQQMQPQQHSPEPNNEQPQEQSHSPAQNNRESTATGRCGRKRFDVSSRFFDVEERRLAADTQRNEELSLIRRSIEELCGVMRDILEQFKE